MSSNKIFIIISLSFFLGIIIGNYLPFDWQIFSVIIVMLVIILITFWSEKFLRIIILIILFILLGILRFGLVKLKEPTKLINDLNNQKVKLIGIISEEPDVREDKTNLVINVLETNLFKNPTTIKDNYRILVEIKDYSNYHYGDKIELAGKLMVPPEFDDFSYRNYLSRYGIYLICKKPEIKKISENKGNKIISILITIKQKFIEKIDRTLPEPQASILSGILYGTKRMIPKEILNQFNQTGLTHIVVISGYNITIIASLLFLIFSFLPKKLNLIFVFIGIILFTLFVGATPSVVRATIMGSIGLLALRVKRKNNVFTSLLLAALIMVLINPKILRFDISFQLSFLSTTGLIFLTSKIEKFLKFLPYSIKEPLSLTLGAQIFASPIILYNFQQISLIAPLANILVLPLIPYLMIIGFIGSGLSFLSIFIGRIINWGSWLLLTYIIKITNFLSQLPKASLQFRINFFTLILYYSILLSLLFLVNNFKKIIQKFYFKNQNDL